eukprot:Nitzschia sp. Nitz4//scaffold208_size52459//48180//51599//NITZ4_006819-RA/size52459-processed-gene-0.36-mRNA-1//-1//CDS//3329541678//1820//frame0
MRFLSTRPTYRSSVGGGSVVFAAALSHAISFSTANSLSRNSLVSSIPRVPWTSRSGRHVSSPPSLLQAQTRSAKGDLIYNATSADPSSLFLAELVHILESNVETGLSDQHVQERSKQYGTNTLQSPIQSTWLGLIAEQFEDRLVQILLVVAVLSAVFALWETAPESAELGASSWYQRLMEPFVIAAILVINAAVGVWQSQSASNSLKALQDLQPTLCTPLRDGTWRANTPASELVPGDIIQLCVGDKVPADARIVELQSSTLQVDETTLTGESVTVSKVPGDDGRSEPGVPLQQQYGMLFSGTMITSGKALAMVVQTGMDTQFGKIQKSLLNSETGQTSSTPKTPLAMQLDAFGATLTKVIGAICASIWLIHLPKLVSMALRDYIPNSLVWEDAIHQAKMAVALGVAAIPEGLPAVITLCLSLGTRRLAEQNVIVRKLPSVETLGCTSVICTDKTGTLTTNEMTVVSLVLLEGNKVVEHAVEGTSYAPIGHVEGIPNEEAIQNSTGAIADVVAVSALCNDASILRVLEQNKETDSKKKPSTTTTTTTTLSGRPKYERVGEPTEAALCVLAEKLLLGNQQNSTLELLLSQSPSYVDRWRSLYPRMATLEFDRNRKSMSVLADYGQPGGVFGRHVPSNRLLVKGAPNLLLERCTHIKRRDGSVVPLTGPLRQAVQAKITSLSGRPLRCLALAVKEASNLENSLSRFDGNKANEHPMLNQPRHFSQVESGLTLVGVAGIKDPARPDVAESIEACHRAGIRVWMITGDARDTAVAIAKEVGIVQSSDNVVKAVEGRAFFQLPHEKQLEYVKTGNLIVCRAEPADKQKLIQLLQALGEVPAMTGDGVNDAPALQQASIGIAMGSGTEVSKEASDMILADDKFSTIVRAVEEGRTIYANMQSFICFLISCNLGEIFAIVLGTLLGFPEPLTAMHLLWVNLVTDGPPATALGFNPPSPRVMEAKPRPASEPILTRWLWTRYTITGLYVGMATLGAFASVYTTPSKGIGRVLWSSLRGHVGAWKDRSGTVSHGLAQSMALTTLVCIELLKALSAVSMDFSLIEIGPSRNPWLLLGVGGPFLLHCLLLYSSQSPIRWVASIGKSMGLVGLDLKHWFMVLQWSLPILLLEELLKWKGRCLNQETTEPKQ